MRHTTSPSISQPGAFAVETLHESFLRDLSELAAAPDADFCSRYLDFIRQTEHAFRVEEDWMDALDLPVIRSHREQHARVLGALHHVYACVIDGDLAIGREAVKRLLPRWFAIHAATMDTPLASEIRGARDRTFRPAYAN